MADHGFCQHLWKITRKEHGMAFTKGFRAYRFPLGRSWYEVFQNGRQVWHGQAHCAYEAKSIAAGRLAKQKKRDLARVNSEEAG